MPRGAAFRPGRRGIKPHGELNRARVPLLWGFNAQGADMSMGEPYREPHPRNQEESTDRQGASFFTLRPNAFVCEKGVTPMRNGRLTACADNEPAAAATPRNSRRLTASGPF